MNDNYQMLPSFAHDRSVSLYCKGYTELTSCALATATRKPLFALKRCASKIIRRRMEMSGYEKEILAVLNKLAYGVSNHDVFADFLTITSYDMLVLSENAYKNLGGKIDENKHNSRICEIEKIKSKYNNELLLKATMILIKALTEERKDFLGTVFEELGLGDARNGQFFTPNHISKIMAKLSLEGLPELSALNDKKYITIADPCIGSGRLAIEACEELRNKGFSYWQYFVEGRDISRLPALMSYLQLSLLGVPAMVFWGDSLAMKNYEEFPTPIALLQGWLPKIYIKPEDFKRKIEISLF